MTDDFRRCDDIDDNGRGCWLMTGHAGDHLPDASGLGAVGPGPYCRHCGAPIISAPSRTWADTSGMVVCQVTPGRYRGHEPPRSDHSHDPFDVPFADYWADLSGVPKSVAIAAGGAAEALAREAFAAGALWSTEDAHARSACYDPWHTAPRASGKALAVDAENLPENVKVAALQAARDVRYEFDDWDDSWDETALAVLGAVWPLVRGDAS